MYKQSKNTICIAQKNRKKTFIFLYLWKGIENRREAAILWLSFFNCYSAGSNHTLLPLFHLVLNEIWTYTGKAENTVLCDRRFYPAKIDVKIGHWRPSFDVVSSGVAVWIQFRPYSASLSHLLLSLLANSAGWEPIILWNEVLSSKRSIYLFIYDAHGRSKVKLRHSMHSHTSEQYDKLPLCRSTVQGHLSLVPYGSITYWNTLFWTFL